MADNLVGCRYIQDFEPGVPPTGGFEWFNPTTGELKIRDGANTQWLPWGDATQPFMGFVTRQGADMLGPFTGVTGWAPQQNPDFDIEARKRGIVLATKNDLASLRRELLARFNTISSEALSNLASSSSTKNNVAISKGTIVCTAGTYTFSIPLPQYDGGTGDTAARTEVLMHGMWPLKFEHEDRDGTGSSAYFTLEIKMTDDNAMTWQIHAGNGVHDYPVTIQYVAIAVR